MRKIRLIKLSDDYFKQIGEYHPNDIEEGYTKIGITDKLPKVGERFYLGGFSTSEVIEELKEDNTFKTTYSTYKIEYLE